VETNDGVLAAAPLGSVFAPEYEPDRDREPEPEPEPELELDAALGASPRSPPLLSPTLVSAYFLPKSLSLMRWSLPAPIELRLTSDDRVR
jgi:hypothetical protein